MQKKLTLFSFSFILFYLLAIMAKQLPGIIHGRFSFVSGIENIYDWFQFAGDLLILYLVALGTYLVLFHFHPKKNYAAIIFLILCIAALGFAAAFSWTQLFEPARIRLSRYFQLMIVSLAGQIVFAALFYLVRYTQHKELQQVTLQLQNRQTELSLLRSQINPHFLFNQLNNIYALVSEKNEQALPAISGLSDLLRYMLYQTEEMTLLITELDYLDKYIALQQLRFEEPSAIESIIDCRDRSVSIPSFLLIPFVENAFKHGQPNRYETWLEVAIESDRKQLTFTCRNTIANGKKDITGGIGLNNVQQRLNLLYPHRHSLDIVANETCFDVKLQLQFANG
jgi:two-component system LytT family sensor kinase